MNDKFTWLELAHLPIVKTQDVLLARFLARSEAIKMDYSPKALTSLATGISEITRNVVQHAGCPGEIRMWRTSDGDRSGLRIVVTDPGAGIDNPQRFLEEGRTSTLGAGLPGTRKLMDQFDIVSAPGMGTTVTMELWRPGAVG